MTAGLLDWLSHVPLSVLYLLMATFAAVENVFPPVPADTVVALGSWLAARGQGSAFWAFFATWVGNIVGAGAMYAVGRRHGTAWMHKRFPALGDAKNERRLRELHGKYGAISLVLSRFVPGVRALVIVSCRSARRNVSCAISSAQSRSPSRRVRYRTSGAWYSRKSRSSRTSGRWRTR